MPITDIEGKPFVSCPASVWEKEQWVKADDHFYCDLVARTLSPQALRPLHPPTMAQCNQCYAQVLEAQGEQELLIGKFGKLRGLELFAGVLDVFRT